MVRNHHFMGIKQEYEKLKQSLHCFVDDTDYKKLEQKLVSLKNLADIENRAISIYDLNRKEFLLKVDKHIELLGYTSKDNIDVNNVDNYHLMIHPDDVEILYDSEIKMYNFLKSIQSGEKKDYKLVYDYRVQSKSGLYIRFLHQLMLYELDKFYNSWIMLIISDVISTYPDKEKPRRFLINTKNKKICLFNEESNIKTFLITNREKEIIELISQGFDSKTISDKLCISLNTVNNHRQHVLQKTSSKNITQAITYLKCIGLL